MNNLKLIRSSTNCCGCSACVDICPKNAIKMERDKQGFLFPTINQEVCVECGQCLKVCHFDMSKLKDLFHPIEVYAATSVDRDAVMHSASGGVFYSIANAIMKQKGVVVGCAYNKEGRTLSVKHIVAHDLQDLKRLQGSKYVQSETEGIYKKVKELAQQNYPVLFSGTPCQVAACRSFLGNDFENVFYVDVICHGVPSQELFKEYIAYLEKKRHIEIEEVLFRDKSKGWELAGSIIYQKNGKKYKKYFKTGSSAYYALFLRAQTYRESCYECPYAQEKRCGDITLGDYWGVEKTHPEYLNSNGGKLNINAGISCIMVNTQKGKALLNEYGRGIDKIPSDLNSIICNNGQMRKPSQKGNQREKLLEIFSNYGYKELNQNYYDSLGSKGLLYRVLDLLPAKKI